MPSTTDLIKISDEIKAKIEELESFKKSLPLLAQKKAETMVLYEKAIALETLSLRSEMAISLIEKIVKGKCAELRMDMDLAESMYKNAFKIIEITEAQLNGYQSINRYLSES